MGLLSLEARVEQTVTSMSDEVIVKIVRKLAFAVWGSLQRHAQQLALASAAAVPAFFTYRYLKVLARELHLEWQWERKCHMTLVSGQLWAPVRMGEMERMRQLKVSSVSPSSAAGGSSAQTRVKRARQARDAGPYPDASPTRLHSISVADFPDGFSERAESTDALSPNAKKRVCFDGTCSLLLGLDEDDESVGEHSDHDAFDSAEMLSGVAKRTLFQDDIWNIGILRDQRMYRKLIEAASKTTIEDPFVTSFLDDSDTWYVMNALVNQLSGLCAVSHLGALHRGELYSDQDAFVVALMVPRTRCNVKRDFLGEEFSETSASLTKLRAVVLKERHVVQIARRRVYMDPNAPPRFEARWHTLELIGDKYRRFEACKILRAAIERQEGEGNLQRQDSRVHSLANNDDCARMVSDSSIGHGVSRMFCRITSPMVPEESHMSEKSRFERVREISGQQFKDTGRRMGLSPCEAEMLFKVLDVNGDGMLSVDEVESEKHKKGRRYAGKNYISMHLQRVFLPVPSCRQLP